MDGQSYTFASAGEFTLLDIRSGLNPLFTLQGRLGPANNWPATAVKALAFGIPGVEAYQVCSLQYSKEIINDFEEKSIKCRDGARTLADKVHKQEKHIQQHCFISRNHIPT